SFSNSPSWSHSAASVSHSTISRSFCSASEVRRSTSSSTCCRNRSRSLGCSTGGAARRAGDAEAERSRLRIVPLLLGRPQTQQKRRKKEVQEKEDPVGRGRVA
ncbi:hypothetical protein DQ04_10731030, partial [Trypanosoma grayi]|uniref:hypothetical protein n=1 Tax=Trypanosoma grayi TaxID=71804 RepID=UPI0004F48E64